MYDLKTAKEEEKKNKHTKKKKSKMKSKASYWIYLVSLYVVRSTFTF